MLRLGSRSNPAGNNIAFFERIGKVAASSPRKDQSFMVKAKFMRSAIHSRHFKGVIHKRLTANGFTLLELLVVLATLAVLALLMLPALAGTKTDTRRLQCQGNQKQLLVGFQLFAQDHNDSYPPAGWANSTYGIQISWDSWLNPYIGSNAPVGNLTAGALSSGRGPSILACPSDTFPKASWLGGNNPILALRSYAMNCVGAAWSYDWQVDDARRTYPLPDLSTPGPSGVRHGVGIYWVDNGPNPPIADWNARGYKTSVVRDPAGSILLCENTHGEQIAGNVWTCVCIGPLNPGSGNSAQFQTDTNTVQQNPSSSTGVNQGIFLYQAQQNSFNYAFHDGHVAALTIQQTVGSGTLTAPAGMWTVAPGD
jgi:prepilin-type N-terminal cleavage/methylation domain-containing protein/prepilin-type processing-associated H-X9-DG protein